MIGGPLAMVGVWVASATLGTPQVDPQVESPAPVLTASSVQLHAATVEALHLRTGQLAVAGRDRSGSLQVTVRPPEGFGPWRLTLRRDSRAGAPPLRWRPAGATVEFQDVGSEPVVVAQRRDGGDAQVRLDVIWAIGWDTPPGHYGSSLEFELESL